MKLEMSVAAVLMPFAVACSQPEGPVVCTQNLVPGIVVTVTDSLSGVMPASTLTAIALEGAYRDSVSYAAPAASALTISLASERAGTYSVTVRKPGYLDWVKNGVTVTKDVCHVTTVALNAKLKTVP